MFDPADHNVFELDDHPIDFEFTLHTLKEFRRHNKRFKANLFCVPKYMNTQRKREVLRHDWIRMYPHGFRHRHKECHELDDDKLRWLDDLRESPEWGNVFKAPRYGYSTDFLKALQERGFIVAMNGLGGIKEVPYMPSWDRRGNVLYSDDDFQFALRHCRYLNDKCFGQPVRSGHFTSIGRRFNHQFKRWLRHGDAGGRRFAFCEDFARPAPIKINIGCGPHYHHDWLNLDHRPHHPNVKNWKFPNPIPAVSNRAEIVYTSHFMNYVADFDAFFLEVWRVLRPGGIYRIEEDDQDSGYRWRKIGQKHATGRILAEPTKRAIFESLQRVGFKVTEVPHDSTQSKQAPEVVTLHSRHGKYVKGEKFIAEAVKLIDIRNLTRAYLDDPRAPRYGEYPYSLNQERNQK